MCAAEPPRPTPLALCQLGLQGYAVYAHQIHSIVPAPQRGEPCLDLLHRLGLPVINFSMRMALRLHTCDTLLLVGQSVQVEPVPMTSLENLPLFLQGLRQRAFLHGWVYYRDSLYYILDLTGVMRGCA